MSLSIGLVGLPNAGKSTLFNALTQQNVLVANYPFATIKPNVGIVPVYDQRVVDLAQIFKSAKTSFATVEFVDIAGLVEGASKGEGLGNQFLSHIRQTTVIAQVIGVFKQSQQALKDLQVIQTELLLADRHSLANQLQKLQKPALNDKKIAQTVHLIKEALKEVDQSTLLVTSSLKDEYLKHLHYLQLLTLKPFVYIFNISDQDLNNDVLKEQLKSLDKNFNQLFLSAQLEMELSQLSSQEQATFLKAYNLPHSGLTTLTQKCFQILGWQTFLTAGPKESKAWMIPLNCSAQTAGGVIHSDIKRGFIAAEVVAFNDLKKYGSLAAAKNQGLVRTEGRDYQLQKDDVVEFKFNV